MATFQKVKLGDITEIVSGGTPDSSNLDYWGNGNINWATLPDLHHKYLLDTHRKITELGLKNSSAKLLPVNTVIFSSRATIGEVSIAKVPTSTNQGSKNFICDPSKVNFEYLYYSLKFNAKKIEQLATGATYKEINKTDFSNVEIALPDLPTQSRIASVLSAYDDLIENNEKRIKALEEMASRLYTEWFVKFKSPGNEKVQMVDSGTEFGMIPEGWEVKKISDLVNVISGFPFKSGTYLESGKYKIVTIKNVHDAKFVMNFDSFINELPEKMPGSCVLKKGDILLSLTGNVGRVCVVYGAGHLLNQRVAKLDPNNSYIREFIYSLFRQERFQKRLEAMSNGAAQQNLSPIQVKDIPVINPEGRTLDQFSNLTRSYFDEAINLNEKNLNLSQIRDHLIPQVVTGKRLLHS